MDPDERVGRYRWRKGRPYWAAICGGSGKDGARRMRWKSAAVPAAVLVIVTFAAAIAAASPTRVGAGAARVTSCTSGAHVAPDTSYSERLHGYGISAVVVTTETGCAGMSFRLSLLGTNGRQLAEAAGVLDSRGSAAPNFTAYRIPAGGLVGMSVTITAGPRPSSPVAATSRHPIGQGFQRGVAGGPAA